MSASGPKPTWPTALQISTLGANRTCAGAPQMSAYDPKRASNAKILSGNDKTESLPACFKTICERTAYVPLMTRSGRPMPDPESALHDEPVAPVERQNRKDHRLRKGHQP